MKQRRKQVGSILLALCMVLAMIPAMGAASPVWAEPTPVYTISGTVTDSVSDVGIAGAVVKLWTTESSTAIAEISTDSGGNYGFDNIPSGRYLIEVTAFGYQNFTRGYFSVENQNVILNAALTAEVADSADSVVIALKSLQATLDSYYPNGNTLKVEKTDANTVTVTSSGGAVTLHGGIIIEDQPCYVSLSIPQGVTVKWQAEVTKAGSGDIIVIEAGSQGTFELCHGAKVTGGGISVRGGTLKLSSGAAIQVTSEAGYGISNNYSTVEMNGGTITASVPDVVGISNDGTLRMTGGEIKASNGSCGIECSNSGVMTMTGGLVEATGIISKALYNRNGSSEINIDGGTVRAIGGARAIFNHDTSSSETTVNIRGGAVVGENGGNAVVVWNKGVVNISGGMVTAENVSSGTVLKAVSGTTSAIYISGGSVAGATEGFGSMGANLKTAAGGSPVYPVILTGLPAATTVSGLTKPAGYGVKDVRTDSEGKLYFWLPEGQQFLRLTAGETAYAGTAAVTSDPAVTAEAMMAVHAGWALEGDTLSIDTSSGAAVWKGMSVSSGGAVRQVKIGPAVNAAAAGDLSAGVYGLTSLGAIQVDEANNFLSAADGVLFSKTKESLIRYPQGKAGQTYSLPETVSTLAKESFKGNPHLTQVTVAAAATNIHITAFQDLSSLTKLTFLGGTPPVFTTDGGVATAFIGCGNLSEIYVPQGKADAYKSAWGSAISPELLALIKETPAGGKGSGGSTTQAIPIPAVSGAIATTTVPAAAGADGKATASVPAAQVDTVLKQAKEAAAKAGEEPRVEIKIEAPKDAAAVEVAVPQAAMASIAGGKLAGLTLSSPVASMTFDSQALNTIAGGVSGDVKFTAARISAEALPAAAAALLEGRPVYEFSVTAGGKNISSFGGKVTLEVPYKLGAGENPNAVIISFINASGNLEVVTNGRYDAAKGTVVFKTDHFSKYAVGYNKISFSDVKDSAWYADAVTFLAAREITGGTTENTFSPSANLTRGQFITMVLKAYGIAPESSGAANFSDAGDTYYTGYLAAAKGLGITEGVGENKFAPTRQITRQEMFTLLYNAQEATGQLPAKAAKESESKGDKTLDSFTDSDRVAGYAQEGMKYLIEAGVVKGSDGKLTPTATTTRAEMAQVLYSLLNR